MTAFRWTSLAFIAISGAIGVAALVVALRGNPVPDNGQGATDVEVAGADALRLGLVPERNVFDQRRRYAPLCRYLADRVHVDVQLRSLPHYRAVVEEMRDGRLDAAFFGSYSYVLAHETAGAEIIARPVWQGGSSQYWGLLFAPTGAGPIDLASAKDLRVALVSKETTAGHLFPIQHFRQHGIMDPAAHFRRVFYAGSHDAAIWAVLRGEADLGACKNTVFEAFMEAHPESRERLRVLARSEAVPSNGLAVAPTVSPSVRARLASALMGMHEDQAGRELLDRFGAVRFILTIESDYEPVYRMARAIGADLRHAASPSTRATDR